jgi:cobalt-zinc-cadmium efflux system outer membrane protein
LNRVAVGILVVVASLLGGGAPAFCQELAIEIPTLEPAGRAAPIEPMVVPAPSEPLESGEPEAIPLEPVPPGTIPPGPIPLPPVENGDGEKRLTLEAAETLAIGFHPAMREAAAQVRALQGNWVQVGLRPNPTIGYAGDEMGANGTAGKQGAFIGQEFVTAGKLGLNRNVAFREQQAAEQRLARTQMQVITTVRKLYVEALVADRSVTLAKQLSEIAGHSVTVSEQRLKALDVPKTALLQSQIENESASLVEQQANERHDAATRRLASVLGVQKPQAIQLDDILSRPLPDLDYATTRERLMRESPELAELRFEVDRARGAVERASAGRVPNINVQTGVQRDNETQDTIANVEVSMPLPVFDRNQGAIAQACGELSAAQAALERRELELDERLTAALRDYRTARERVAKYAGKVLPAAKETLDLVNAGYKQGQLDYVQVLTIQQSYASKNLSYLQDLETAWKKWAEIDGLLVGDVSQTSVDHVSPTSENGMSSK